MSASYHCNNGIDIIDRPTSESSNTMLQTGTEFHRLDDKNNNNNSDMTNTNVSGTNPTHCYTGCGNCHNIVTTNDLRPKNVRSTTHPYTRLLFASLLPSLILLVIIPVRGIVKELSTTSSDESNSHSIVPMVTMLSLFSISYFSITVLCIHNIYTGIIHICNSSETNTADDVRYGCDEQQSNKSTNANQHPDGAISSNNEPSGTNSCEINPDPNIGRNSMYGTPDLYPQNSCFTVFWTVIMFLDFVGRIPEVKDSPTSYNIVTCVGYGLFSVSLMVGIIYLSGYRFSRIQEQQQEFYQQQHGTIEIATISNNDNKPIPESLIDGSSNTGYDDETGTVKKHHYYDLQQLEMKYIFLNKLIRFSLIFVILQQTLGIVINFIDGTTITTGDTLFCLLMVFLSSVLVLILVADPLK